LFIRNRNNFAERFLSKQHEGDQLAFSADGRTLYALGYFLTAFRQGGPPAPKLVPNVPPIVHPDFVSLPIVEASVKFPHNSGEARTGLGGFAWYHSHSLGAEIEMSVTEQDEFEPAGKDLKKWVYTILRRFHMPGKTAVDDTVQIRAWKTPSGGRAFQIRTRFHMCVNLMLGYDRFVERKDRLYHIRIQLPASIKPGRVAQWLDTFFDKPFGKVPAAAVTLPHPGFSSPLDPCRPKPRACNSG
jgi:hypothetical protein